MMITETRIRALAPDDIERLQDAQRVVQTISTSDAYDSGRTKLSRLPDAPGLIQAAAFALRHAVTNSGYDRTRTDRALSAVRWGLLAVSHPDVLTDDEFEILTRAWVTVCDRSLVPA